MDGCLEQDDSKLNCLDVLMMNFKLKFRNIWTLVQVSIEVKLEWLGHQNEHLNVITGLSSTDNL